MRTSQLIKKIEASAFSNATTDHPAFSKKWWSSYWGTAESIVEGLTRDPFTIQEYGLKKPLPRARVRTVLALLYLRGKR